MFIAYIAGYRRTEQIKSRFSVTRIWTQVPSPIVRNVFRHTFLGPLCIQAPIDGIAIDVILVWIFGHFCWDRKHSIYLRTYAGMYIRKYVCTYRYTRYVHDMTIKCPVVNIRMYMYMYTRYVCDMPIK